MINMSYCRFHNTRKAMQECLDALTDGDTLTEEELADCKGMFEEIVGFLFNEFVEIDSESFERWLDSLDCYSE